MTDKDNKHLNIVRVFNAPRDKVFKAWTDPEVVSQWWGPNGVTIPTCEIDAKVGGKLYVVMLAGPELGELAGSEWPMTGIFQEIITNDKLVYTSSAIVDDMPVLDTNNTVTFEDQDGKTKMTLDIRVTRSTPEGAGPLAGMEMGWTQTIDKLESLIGK